MLPYGEDVTMKNDVYIVRIIIIVRFVGHKRGYRSNHSHRQHKKAQTRSRRSDKPPGARHPYPYRNAKFVLCLTQGKFGLLSYAVIQINDTAIHSAGCRDPPKSIVLNTQKRLIGGIYGEKICTKESIHFG